MKIDLAILSSIIAIFVVILGVLTLLIVVVNADTGDGQCPEPTAKCNAQNEGERLCTKASKGADCEWVCKGGGWLWARDCLGGCVNAPDGKLICGDETDNNPPNEE